MDAQRLRRARDVAAVPFQRRRQEAALPRVTAPTLVLMGDKDPDFADPRAEAEWVAQALHGSAVMIPDAGHYPQSQAPRACADAVLRFLERTAHRA